MATDQEFVDFVTEQLDASLKATSRKMFGEYAIYSKGKVVALACDNRLFVKPTEAGRAFIGAPVEAPPYEGAKNSFLIEDGLEDARWLSELIAVTEKALPEPKPKKKSAKKKTPAKKTTPGKKAAKKRRATKPPRKRR